MTEQDLKGTEIRAGLSYRCVAKQWRLLFMMNRRHYSAFLTITE